MWTNTCDKSGCGKKKAWLVVNEFLRSAKFAEIHAWLLRSAEKAGIEMKLLTNAQIYSHMAGKIPGGLVREEGCGRNEAGERPEFVLFWDKDVRLAAYLEALSIPVYNSADAIAACDDKSLTYLKLWKAGLPMPETILAPMTFANIGYTNYHYLTGVGERLGYPMVVKECFGSFGAQVYLAQDQAQLREIMDGIGAKPALFQKFIGESRGRDVRLQVVGEDVVTSMYRYSTDGDFRANITNGGSMKKYDPSKEETGLAVKAAKVLGLDFAGVDILFAKDGPIICEVNSNAHFKNIYDCTGVDAADCIMDYIICRSSNGRSDLGRRSG